MLNTLAILERIKEYKGWSDYRAAKELEVGQTTVSAWRNRGSVMTDKTGLKAAEILGVPEEMILMGLAAERYINSPIFKYLEELADRLEAEQAANKQTKIKKKA